MRGHGASPRHPFGYRLRKDLAIPTCGKINGFGAAVTLINDGMASAPVESASLFRHKAAIDTRFDCLTDHLKNSFLTCMIRDFRNNPSTSINIKSSLHNKVENICQGKNEYFTCERFMRQRISRDKGEKNIYANDRISLDSHISLC